METPLGAVALGIILLISFVSYYAGRTRVRSYQAASGKIKKGKQALTKMHSRPRYYGYCAFLWACVPALFGYVFFTQSGFVSLDPNLLIAVVVLISILGACAAYYTLKPKFKARVHFEKWVKAVFILSAVLAITITIMIIGSVLFESLRFFDKVPASEFFFGTKWSPQGAPGSFGAIPVFLGTLLITFIAMVVAAPLGLLSAIYLSEYAKPGFRAIAKPILEVLAGVPTVVYGYFAAITFAPFLRDLGESMSLDVAAESALAAGVVMGIMIIPFVMSLSDDVMNAVPKSMREASMGLGATKSETIKQVIIPAALPGVMGALLLAVSRGIGETMIVVMAAGLAANLTINPLDSVTTVTAQIVTLLVGDQEFDSAKTLAAFALSLTLFIMTLILNMIAMIIVKKYREQYE